MGQISSIFDSDEGIQNEELECISEEDECFDSAAQTPLDEYDSDSYDSEFEDCNEDISEEEEETNHRKSGGRGKGCFLGNYEENDYSEDDSEEEEILQEEVINLVRSQEEQLESQTNRSPIEEATLSIQPQSDNITSVDTIHVITNNDATTMVDDLINGKYDDSIYDVWHLVERSEFQVDDFGYTYFLPVLVLSKLICSYFEKGGNSFADISMYSSLLQNYISEWINTNREDSQNSFIVSHPSNIQYLYKLIKDIVYFLNMIEESELANRYYWILEYIDIDRIDPVSYVQTRTKEGSYHKMKGSRYDSNNTDMGLIAMLSPQSHESESSDHHLRSPVLSPNRRHSTDVTSLSAMNSADGDDNWRTAGKRKGNHQYSYSSRSYRSDKNWNNRGNSSSSPTYVCRRDLHRSSSMKDSFSYDTSGKQRSPSYHGFSHNRNYSGYSRTSDEHSDSISRTSSNHHLRELQRWNSTELEGDDRTLEELRGENECGGTSWDQFTLNKEKFGIDADFNEALYTVPMSSLQMNEKEWKEVVDAAKEMEVEEDNGKNRIHTEIKDGEEDAVLYSDVKINKESCERKSDGTDPFIDSSIRK